MGARRFAPPSAKQPWSTPLVANTEGAVCHQHDPYPVVSEDCLFLNVYAPLNVTDKLPVVVYIHGGGFTKGTANDYNSTRFAKAGTVAVALNYRLGLFGFLALKEHQSAYNTTGGMNGLLDQIEALKWVQNNIAAFGGDPEQVTLAGESAGGLSVCLLNVAEAAQGLFKRAFIMSGACNGGWAQKDSANDSMAKDEALAKLAFNTSTLSDLRALPISDLLSAYERAKSPNVEPSVDGLVVTQPRMKGITRSNAEKLVVGTTNMDGLLPLTGLFNLPEKVFDWPKR